MDTLDYYALLNIPQHADSNQIKNAYKRKAIELHPDKNLGKASATQEFQELQSVKDILLNPVKRANYDLKYPDIKSRSEAKKAGDRRQQTEAACRQAEEERLRQKRQEQANERSRIQARRAYLEKMRLQITSLQKERNILGEKFGKVMASQIERKALYERAKRTWLGTLIWGPLEIKTEEQERRNQSEREDLQQINSLRIKLAKLTNQLDPLIQSYAKEENEIRIMEEERLKLDRLEVERLAREKLMKERDAFKAQEEAERKESRRRQEEAHALAERVRREREAQQKRQEEERLRKEKEPAEASHKAHRQNFTESQSQRTSTQTRSDRYQDSHRFTQSRRDCKHPRFWNRLQGPNTCSRCQRHHQKFIFQCPACQMLCCFDCKGDMVEEAKSGNHNYNYANYEDSDIFW